MFSTLNLHHLEYYIKHHHQKFIGVRYSNIENLIFNIENLILNIYFFHNFYFLFINILIYFLIYIAVACSLTHEEILQDWEWLHSNLMDTLTSFDTEEEITEFVCCKIQSIIANNVPDCQFADGII